MEDIDAPSRPRGRPSNATRQAAMRGDMREPVRPQGGIRVMTAMNRYEFDRSKIPQGMTVEWRARTVMGAEHTEAIIADEMNGWVPVPASRHPELAGRNPANPDQPIVRGGLMLMERPQELTDEARMLDSVAAVDQVATQLRRLRLDGQERGAKPKIKREFAEIADDE